jgi:tRNA threonylcarbamoyladenosine biosynthesis protein TsaB
MSPALLAIDTSSGFTSAALWREGLGRGGLVGAREDKTVGGQSRLLMPMIEALLSAHGWGYADCDAIVSTLGPGGFTSLRTGLATARALALAAEKPFIGVSSLEVMAFQCDSGQCDSGQCDSGQCDSGEITVAIDAHRGEWYAQRFRRTEEGLTALDAPFLALRETLPENCRFAPSDAAQAACYADHLWRSGQRDFLGEPIYLRPPDAVIGASFPLSPLVREFFPCA